MHSLVRLSEISGLGTLVVMAFVPMSVSSDSEDDFGPLSVSQSPTCENSDKWSWRRSKLRVIGDEKTWPPLGIL